MTKRSSKRSTDDGSNPIEEQWDRDDAAVLNLLKEKEEEEQGV